jgi:uncharacterized membrane protein YphA (DoxX/SURF4 family)
MNVSPVRPDATAVAKNEQAGTGHRLIVSVGIPFVRVSRRTKTTGVPNGIVLVRQSVAGTYLTAHRLLWSECARIAFDRPSRLQAVELHSRSLAVLFVRISLALYLGAAGLALLTGNTGGKPVWLPLDTFRPVAPLLGIFDVAAATLLLIGYATTATATATAAMLIVVLVAWLMANPLHNTMNHLMPFMTATLVTLAFTRDRRGFAEPTRVELVLLFARLFLGSIFFAQGTSSVMKAGLAGFARKVYVEPLAGSWVPEPLLWGAGLTNPIIQIATGVLLMLGLRTRFAATVMAAFLVSIFLGHLLKDPFDRGVSPHAYAMATS